MPDSLAHKIIKEHLAAGKLIPGEEIALKIDHVLLQDATGTMAMLEFEALDVETVRAELAVQFVDHNLIQTDHKNADDHQFLRTASARFGFHFSPPGNGICHQVYLERFGTPGKTLLGADSHTPSSAGVSTLGIGAGGLDAAMAAAGYPYHLPCPIILGVKLTGRPPAWVGAKDVILEMLRRHGVKGCVGKIVEYYGPGVTTLSATDRETIANLGTELGATSTVFPSDQNTRAYLAAQGREQAWRALAADTGANYDEDDEIDLATLEPMIACPSSPGNAVPVREAAGARVAQAIIGSCANSSFRDLMMAAGMVTGRRIHPGVSFHINPGSRQVLLNVVDQGGLSALLAAGARVHEPGCHGCIGIGQAPGVGQVSLRTFTRNFPGRSGTKDDQVYLCSPETATAAALTGLITDPRDLDFDPPRIIEPEKYLIDESSIVFPTAELKRTEIVRGPNIKPFPPLGPLPETLEVTVALKTGDNITTDDIMPAGAEILPLRSNIEAISRFVFGRIAPDFAETCRKHEVVAVVGGENYGQGSSREHAALAPRYLGVRVKIAKSFARIHKANLCNFGIVPLTFKTPRDYDRLHQGARLILPEIRSRIERGETEIPLLLDGQPVMAVLDVSLRQRRHLVAGGALNFVREELKRKP